MGRKKRDYERAMERFSEAHPRDAGVVLMHYSGMPPSAIDEEMGRKPGYARRVMCRYWKFFDEMYREPREK